METSFKIEDIRHEIADELSIADVEMAKLNLSKTVIDKMYSILAKSNWSDPVAGKDEMLEFAKLAMDLGALNLTSMSMEAIECKKEDN